jgi:hypothetical protein
MSEHHAEQPHPSQERQPQDEMDITTARTILQAVIDTHEETLTKQTPLDTLGGYTVGQLRQAERVVAQSIIQKVPQRYELVTREKRTPEGTLQLSVGTLSVGLNLIDFTRNRFIANRFPLSEPGSLTRIFTEYADSHSEQPGGTRLSDLEKNPTLPGFQQMLRGVRWMSANLLNWENQNTILPEQLDQKALASIPQPTRSASSLPQS